MKNPCYVNGKDCENRKVGCRISCIPWKEYEVIKFKEYEENSKKIGLRR